MKIVWTFIAGVGLAGLVLALLPIPERARYDTLNQDAARLRYVYQRIVDSKEWAHYCACLLCGI